MPCFHPITGYLARKTNDSGKRSIVFNQKDGYYDKSQLLPCGRCIGCRLERSRQWATRCVHETQLYENNCFITLTFREASPIATLTANGRYQRLKHKTDPTVSLHKHFIQLFWKRLRKHVFGNQKGTLRYYHCAEYGDESKRPHHHAIIFNYDFPDKKYKSTKHGNNYFTSKTLETLWPHGNSIIGNATFESAAYVARYCTKKITGTPAKDHYHGRLPEYATMSRRPGIGKGWLDKYVEDVYNNDFVVIRGHKCKVPKFYDRNYDLTNPKDYGNVKAERVHAQRGNPSNHYRRLEAGEEIQKARMGLLKQII